MKKQLLFGTFVLFLVLQGFSQSSLPPVDSRQYEQMKQQLILPANATVHQSDRSPIYTDGTEVPVRSNYTHYRSPATCGSGIIPCSATIACPACDDCSSNSAYTLGFNFCFYGTTQTSVWVNNNGNLSFGSSYGTFSPVAFPSNAYTMIAPFWGDVETIIAGSGQVTYSSTPTHFIVTWCAVGYYSGHIDKLNSFQVILTDGADPILPPGNNIGFNYGQMQWTTGDASGGVNGFGGSAATVGINQGNGVGYTQIGQFDVAGGAFVGPYATNNGVGWLTNKSFYFNTCSATNIPPICSTLNNCDTVNVCGLNDTTIVNALFLSPELGQNTVITVNLNGLANATIISNTSGNTADAQVQIIGTAANAGYHVITFTATDNGNPVGVTTINATIFIDTSSISPLNPVISGVLAICGGDSTILNVTPTNYDSYLWNTGASGTSVTAHTSGLYSVTCTLQGCQKTVGVHVAVDPSPTPIIIGPTITACGTGTTTLTVDSLIYSSYLWSNGSTTTSITVGGGSYSVTVTDANGCTATSPTVNVTSQPAPLITAHNDTSFCSGSANLWVTFPGPAVPTTCGLSVTGACTGTANTGTIGTGLQSCSDYSFPAPFGNEYTSVIQQYLYTAAELNAAGITAGKIDQLDFDVTLIDVTIFSSPITTYHNFEMKMGCTNLTTFSSFPSSLVTTGLSTVFPSSTYNVTTGWDAFPFTTPYEWDGISNVIVQVCFSEFPPAFTYTENCQTAMTATANYSSQEYESDQEDACTSQNLGFYDAQQLHPDIRLHYCVAPTPSAFTYLWTSNPAGGNIANDTAQYTTGTPGMPTEYIVTVTNRNGGCSATDSVHVGVINIAAMHITPAGPFCSGSPIDTLQVSVPIGTGVFSGSGITDTNLGIFNPAVAAIGFDTIHYTVAGSICGAGDTSIVIQVSNFLNTAITPVPNLCTSYAPVTLHAANPGGSWSGNGITDTINGLFNPSLPGLVGGNTVYYTIYAPCYSKDSTVINVSQQLFATINPVGGPYCIGASPVQLTSVGAGGTWVGPGMSPTGLFTPYLAGTGTFTVFHYMTAFCGDTASAQITVLPNPTSVISSDITSGCEPTTIHFTSVNTPPGGTCSWDFGDGHSSNNNCAPANNYVSFNGGVPYNVTISYTDPAGCMDTVTNIGMITIYSQPVASFGVTPQPTDITLPEIHFLDNSTGLINTWVWTFGTGDGSTLQSPTYTYTDTGTYHVVLTVSNIYGCTDTAHGTVVIDPILTCYIPNAFTPDGNGTNDIFILKGTDIIADGFGMSIFDRWGERIFYTEDLNTGWNGRRGNVGDVVELGVYVYKINLKDWKGLAHEYIGHVTVVR